MCILISHSINAVTKNRIKTNASTTSSSVTTITILITIIRRIHYEISLTQQQMHEHEFFQATNRKKVINRKQTASSSPKPNITPSWMCPKTIANRRSDIPQRTEIKIKTKIPNETKLAHITYPNAYFHFIHAFGSGRRSYASEPMAKRTVRCIKKRHRLHMDIRNHVMQSCCIAFSLVGGLRQHFAAYKYLQ